MEISYVVKFSPFLTAFSFVRRLFTSYFPTVDRCCWVFTWRLCFPYQGGDGGTHRGYGYDGLCTVLLQTRHDSLKDVWKNTDILSYTWKDTASRPFPCTRLSTQAPFPFPFEYIYSPSHGPVVDDRTNPVGQSQVSEMSLQNITLLMPVLHWISLQESRRENMLAICT